MKIGDIKHYLVGVSQGVRLLLLSGALAIFSNTPSWAINNSNVTFSAITTNFNGILTWPWDDTGTNNTLSILNGAVVIDTAHWFGGINSVANRNFVIVSDPGSIWSNNAGNSFIGREGAGNQLLVTNGGAWVSANVFIGSLLANASNNVVLVTGSNSVFRTGDFQMGGGGVNNSFTVADQGLLSASGITIGTATIGNQMVITNGGRAVVTGSTIVGENSANSSNNTLIVTGPGSVLSNSANLQIGRASGGNQLIISNQALVVDAQGFVGSNSTNAGNNSVIVTGTGSVWSNTSSIVMGGLGSGNRLTVTDTGRVYAASMTVGNNGGGRGFGNTVTITNGGQFYTSGSIVLGETDSSTSNNTLIVTGRGSVMTNGGNILIGRNSVGNQFIVSDGGLVVNAQGLIGATATSGSNNTGTVTGPGSVWSNTSSLVVGNASAGNTLTITNGGKVYAVGANAGINGNAATSNNLIVITGDGTLLQSVTSGLTAANTSQVQVLNGATLEAPSLNAFSGSTISNAGSVYQFTTANPILNALTGGSIVLNNGVLSFRNVTDANVYAPNNASIYYFPANMTFLGNNTFRLNSSSNSTVNNGQEYTFTTTSGPTNFSRLEMVNGTTLWSSKYVTFAPTGSFLASNTVGTVAAVVTNLGTMTVVNSKMTFQSNVVIHGSYTSDPSTNFFLGDVTLSSSGTLSGGAGDLFDFKKSLYIGNSVNPTGAFNLASSIVSFSGGGRHTNAITGVDLGNNGTNGYANGFTAENFSYGRLTLGSTNDSVYFSSGSGAASNALYITWLDLAGFTNQFSSVSNMITSLLFAPTNINIYYLTSASEPYNAYLLDQVYHLDNGLGGPGGFLMPAIPEPSAMLLFVLGTCAMLWRRRSQ